LLEGDRVNPDVAARVQGADDAPPPLIVGVAGADPLAVQRLRADIIGHDTVPSAPAVLLEILSLLEDEDDPLRRLSAAIERDGGLTSRILHTANSSFFGQARTVATVERAMLVLGVAMVRSIAVSVAVFQTVGDNLASAEVDEVWRHSLATGIAARVLAVRTGLGERDEAFTAGLLHDAGRMLLGRRFPGFYRALRGGDAVPLDVAERAGLGVDHATAGGWLFDAWQLPQEIVAAVAQHHAVAPAAGLPTLVSAANAVVRYPDPAALLSNANDGRSATVRAAMTACGLTPETWSELAASLGGGGPGTRGVAS
jgi:putative nucleotidyltransferase with HDIG domain